MSASGAGQDVDALLEDPFTDKQSLKKTISEGCRIAKERKDGAECVRLFVAEFVKDPRSQTVLSAYADVTVTQRVVTFINKYVPGPRIEFSETLHDALQEACSLPARCPLHPTKACTTASLL